MQDANRASTSLTWIAVGGFVLLALLALTVPIDHDEGQYIAATRLVAEGWRPFLDFPYLQTPLQPYVLAPLQWLFPGHLLIASRNANALFVTGAAWLAGKAAIRLSGRQDIGWLAALLVLLCDSVQFGGSVARNDALPLFLFALGLERLFSGRLLVAGLALGLAASAKVSYALPAAAAAAVMLVQYRAHGPRRVGALIAGLFLGGLPTLIFLFADPHKTWFYIVTYSVDAVRAFQTLNGSLDQLGLGKRLLRFAKFAAMGPLILLLLLALRDAAQKSRRPDAMIVAVFALALLAALLPMPMYRQYLVPVVIPTILVLAASGTLERALTWRRPALLVSLGVAAAAGTFRSAKEAITTPADERPLAVDANARAIGELVRASGGRTIASLDAVRASDSGLALDRRLAPGPFLFRAGNLAACDNQFLCPVTFDDLTSLDRVPPAAVVTGSEREEIGSLRVGLDGPLDNWALSHGYHAQRVGPSTVWIRP